MISNLSSLSKRALAYLGDEAHRRFVVTIIAFVAAHLVGQALDEASIGNALEVLVVGFGVAWSRSTPDLDDTSTDEAGA
jgi:hypothetical protein